MTSDEATAMGGWHRVVGRWRAVWLIALVALLLAGCADSAATTARLEASPPTTITAATPEPARPSPTAASATATLVPATTGPSASPTTAPTATIAVAPTAVPTPAAVVPPPASASPTVPPAPLVALVPTPAPRAAASGLPQRLRIPRLRIDTRIEHVGLDADGAMAPPARYDTVAWYRLGTRPGQLGSAVIAGHFDSKTGPAIFWYLKELRPRDEIFVRSDDDVERRFIVQETASYRFDEAPIDRIFAAGDRVWLNLITCGGSFDRQSQNYDQRLVVYATMAG